MNSPAHYRHIQPRIAEYNASIIPVRPAVRAKDGVR